MRRAFFMRDRRDIERCAGKHGTSSKSIYLENAQSAHYRCQWHARFKRILLQMQKRKDCAAAFWSKRKSFEKIEKIWLGRAHWKGQYPVSYRPGVKARGRVGQTQLRPVLEKSIFASTALAI